jgi:predicted dehydrogenase/threonine dehydrogenase-like Zn-dependent dehydrogenase
VKQVCLSSGQIAVLDVPPPACVAGGVLVRTSHSLISTGTEMAVTGGGGGESLVRKALTNPDLVRKVWEKVGSVGVRQTVNLIRARQGSALALGYSTAGEVIEVGAGVETFKVGDRVACAGAGYANHAEINFVPHNLVNRVPDAVPYADAAFATLGAIALQGVRRLGGTLGEQIVVMGLGLVGQLTVQLLRRAGCRVFGVDLMQGRVDLARQFGLEDGVLPSQRDPQAVVEEWTGGIGADGVVVCASGGDAGFLNRCFDLCRPKGRLVLVGDVPIRVNRDKIYRKELDFFISCSYGPGRYDPGYEEKGLDYPLPYVRWTEGRNLGEILRLLAAGDLQVSPLVHAVRPVDDAPAAYASLQGPERPIAVLLDYRLAEREAAEVPRTVRVLPDRALRPGQVRLGVIGAGSFFRSVHLPNLERHGGFVVTRVATRRGLAAREVAIRHAIPQATTDAREILDDPDISAVLIATRHDLHASLVTQAARAGKHVFVEKPLGLTVAECQAAAAAARDAGVLVAVGFNRRFAPLARAAKAIADRIREPKTVVFRVNAGPLPPDHWLRDPVEGGGRLRGEGVHFFDFLRFMVGADPVRVEARALDRGSAGVDPDNIAATVSFADGSLGVMLYVSQGHTGLAKERVEIFGGGQSIVIDDFAALECHGVAAQKGEKRRNVDKGHYELLAHFHDALTGVSPLEITAEDGYWATWCAEQAQEGLRAGA